MNGENKVPEGYMKNGQGHLVPVENVKAIDKQRDALVRRIIAEAKVLAHDAEEFKDECFKDVAEFVETAAARHKVALGGREGNVQLTSFDGNMKVVRAKDNQITFSEGMTVARKIIFDCIAKWTEGADANLAALVQKAFEVDRQGHLSASKIMALLSYKIADKEWERAMKIIRESIQVVGTKSYVRFYERDGNGEFRQIAPG